jgi:hypothetical protein
MDKIDYLRYLINKPIREAGPKYELKNRMNPTMTYLSAALLPEVKQYIEFGWVWGLPEPNPHTPQHMHRFDELVLHLGSDYRHAEELGAEIEYAVGGQPIIFNTTSGMFVPRWLRHGPLTWKKYSQPHIQMTVTLGTGNMREGWVDMNGEEAKHHIANEISSTDYRKYMVERPEYSVAPTSETEGLGPTMTLMSNVLVPGCNNYIEGRWVYGASRSKSDLGLHTHDYDEIKLFIGTDWKNPEELGGEIEFMMEEQSLKIERTSTLFVPRGVKHGSLIRKKYTQPYLELKIIPGISKLLSRES